MRTPGFRSLARLAALVCLVLALVWGGAPEPLLAMWGVAYSYPVGLVSRRGAALFLGLAVMFHCARDAGPSPARSAMLAGFAVGCAALALLGIAEFVGGHAGPAILLPVCFEIALALLYALSFLKGKTT